MKKNALTALGALAMCALPASAGPILTNGTYYEFLFGPAPVSASVCGVACTPTINPVSVRTVSPPWTFSGAAGILVLDLFSAGDMFDLFDNGLLLGSTSNVANTGINSRLNDIACALTNSAYSRGAFSVGAGPHSLTINHTRNEPDSVAGAAVFSVTAIAASTPEPATIATFGASLFGLAILRRRRRHVMKT
jgi:hypothetical protein